MMETKIVDARGMACPLPVVNTKKAIDELTADTVLTVLVDNEISVQNLTKFATQRNLAVTSEKKAEKEYAVEIQVVLSAIDPAAGATPAEDFTCEIPQEPKSDICVVLSANVMGTGEEKLGKSLMKAFVFALTKQDVLPKTILCYNTGAYLTCEGSDALEDLKAMAAEGVNIMTCGTCLDFYGIKEKLAVGTVTNMYEIVETMEKAGKVIRP